LKNNIYKNDLACLKSNFCFLSEAITDPEKSTLSLHEGITIILDVKDKLSRCNGRVTELVKTKMALIFMKNEGFETLLKIRNIINILASFKYAPVTSCDVERIFS